ncbi:hypothetical protein cand_009340 [Cryptosporidium andersoni]|uniref:HIT-type domain-containing protein n=1 Tax=Cryptosporidium andersoni TaxID=117008 RepID=A0A1J4MVJ7_9CRYT|nr:hypothetical protein cand_009340 [Cryptosporidium andersoni]
MFNKNIETTYTTLINKDRNGICHNCTNNAKYTCPACLIRSCCLSCVEAHKKLSGCNGDRIKTLTSKLIPRSQYNEDELWTDFKFLEDTRRVIDVAVRNLHRDNVIHPNTVKKDSLIKVIKDSNKRDRTSPIPLLKKACLDRKIKIEFCPVKDMYIRKTNTTYYNKHLNIIYWKIECIFQIEDSILISGNFSEKYMLRNIILDLYKSEYSQLLNKLNIKEESELINMIENDKVEVFLSPFKSSIKPFKMNLNFTLGENLSDQTIVEYPRIKIILSNKEEH